MQTPKLIFGLCFGFVSALSVAQTTAPLPAASAAARGEHHPPAQAFADCKGKKAGESVQHTTPEGKVAATCVDSPEGLVARPNQKRADLSGAPRK